MRASGSAYAPPNKGTGEPEIDAVRIPAHIFETPQKHLLLFRFLAMQRGLTYKKKSSVFKPKQVAEKKPLESFFKMEVQTNG